MYVVDFALLDMPFSIYQHVTPVVFLPGHPETTQVNLLHVHLLVHGRHCFRMYVRDVARDVDYIRTEGEALRLYLTGTA